jgi:hypothetical protein
MSYSDWLTSEGDILTVDDTHRLALRVELDTESSINDYDSDGFTEEYAHRYCDGFVARPDNMDGNAMKIEVDRDLWIWWQPYNGEIGYVDATGTQGSAKWSALPSHVRLAEKRRITDLLQAGFLSVGCLLQESVSDSYGGEHWVTVAEEWLGGCTDVGSVVDDLCSLLVGL